MVPFPRSDQQQKTREREREPARYANNNSTSADFGKMIQDLRVVVVGTMGGDGVFAGRERLDARIAIRDPPIRVAGSSRLSGCLS